MIHVSIVGEDALPCYTEKRFDDWEPEVLFSEVGKCENATEQKLFTQLVDLATRLLHCDPGMMLLMLLLMIMMLMLMMLMLLCGAVDMMMLLFVVVVARVVVVASIFVVVVAIVVTVPVLLCLAFVVVA